MRVIWQFLRVFGRAGTYDPRRNYALLVGLLAGLPVPVISVWTHLYALKFRVTVRQLLLSNPVHWAFLAVPFFFAFIFGGFGALRMRRDARLSEVVRRLAELSTTDELTGLSNARYLQGQLDLEMDRAGRNQGQFSVVLFDLDKFKQVNDTRGHPNGDVALREVARLVRSCRRRYDSVARCGGDEFVLLVADAGREEAQRVAERLRSALAAHGFLATHSAGPSSITASFGVATYPDDGPDKAAIMAAADRALYAAKRRGGNAVCAASSTAPPAAPALEAAKAGTG